MLANITTGFCGCLVFGLRSGLSVTVKVVVDQEQIRNSEGMIGPATSEATFTRRRDDDALLATRLHSLPCRLQSL